MNGVFWTLPFEWQFYLLFPLLFVLLVRAGPWTLAAVGLATVFSAKAYVMVTGDGAMHAQLPIRLDAFVLGMCAGRVAARTPPTFSPSSETAMTRASRAVSSFWAPVLLLRVPLTIAYPSILPGTSAQAPTKQPPSDAE